MSKFDNYCTIRQAKLSEQKNIMNFIHDFWSANHILATDKEFFAYEHNTKEDTNFFIAIDNNSKKIIALQGFIPYGEYPGCHICGVITIVDSSSKIPLLGIEVMKRMLEETKPISYCGIGTNPNTMLPLVKKFFKRSTGKMNHFFFLNSQIKDFKIISISQKTYAKIKKIKINVQQRINIKNLISENDLVKYLANIEPHHNLPKKTSNYIVKRYFRNPKYLYKFFLISAKNKGNISLLIGREVMHNHARALRIIDFIGDIEVLGMLNNWLVNIANDNQYEYVDLLCTGLNEDIIKKSGFLKKSEYTDVIIPTYFEPFVNENIDIHFEKSSDELILFKGDADGDRPSQ
jgi:hypothetical protein